MVVTEVLLNILAQFLFFFVSFAIFAMFGAALERIFFKLILKFRWITYAEFLYLGADADDPNLKFPKNFHGLNNLFSWPAETFIRLFFAIEYCKDENGRRTTQYYLPKFYNPWQSIGMILASFSGIITAVFLICASMLLFVPSTFDYAYATLSNSLSSGLSFSTLSELGDYGIKLFAVLKDVVLSLGNNDVWGIVLFVAMALCATLAFGTDLAFGVFKRIVYLPSVIVVSFAANFIFALINYDVYTMVANGANVFGAIIIIAMLILLCAYIALILLHVLVFLVTWPFRKATQAASAG